MPTQILPSPVLSATKDTAMTKRAINFSAGPACLPESVIHQAQSDLWDIAGSGIGILEHSHRGKVFDRVLEEAVADCRAVGGIPDNYHVLFIQGGASTQFAMVPMNFLGSGQTADYLDTGVWANKAIKEAQIFGKVNIAASSKDKTYNYIPDEGTRSYTPGAAYCHYCSNNTIYGTEFRDVPSHPTSAPIICDASSNIFSRPLDVTRHAMIYAGAQKNLGPAGCVLVIISDEFLKSSQNRADLPTMMRYSVHAENESRYNTPNTFAIYLMGQVFKWIKSQGGLTAIEAMNNEKAAVLYNYLEATDFYTCPTRKQDRSNMNIVFKTPSEDLDRKFLAAAGAAGLDGLAGHRSAGGMRASIYNAFPIEGVRTLVDFMKGFEKENG